MKKFQCQEYEDCTIDEKKNGCGKCVVICDAPANCTCGTPQLDNNGRCRVCDSKGKRLKNV